MDRTENIVPLLLCNCCRGNMLVCEANGCCISCFWSLPSNGSTCHMAPSSRLFVPKAYRYFFFSEGCACDVCDRRRLPSPWLSFRSDYSPAAPSLRPLVMSGSLIRCVPVQVYHLHHLFRGLCLGRLFFRFGGGRHLHDAQSLTFPNPMEVPTACFTTSNSSVWPRASYNVFFFPDVAC
jgi:hypothetical protein